MHEQEIQLRAGCPADAEAVSALIASFQRQLIDEPSGAAASQYTASVSAEAERAYLSSSRYEYTVAESTEGMVGFIALRDRTHLFHLFVDTRHHRHGVARRLWQFAKVNMLAGSMQQRVTVNSSLAAVRVYEAFGFIPAGDITRLHGISFLPMATQLTRDAL